MVPRALVEEMAAVDPASPAYVGRIARWIRSRPQEVEGLYVSPIAPAAAQHIVAVVTEIVSRYAVDGLHLDYLRYPSEEFDYGAGALAEFRAEVAPRLPVVDRQRLARQAAVDPLAYTTSYPEAWARFRRSRLTSLVMRVRTAVKDARPAAIFSAAVVADQMDAEGRRLQDWRTWLELGLLDVVCPLAYTLDGRLFESQIAAARAIPGAHGLWPGIGAYRIPPTQTVENILTGRRLGATGFVLFSYDAVTAAPGAGDYLAEVARLGFSSDGQIPAGSR